tara:strand:- start:357 stop:608 length:252 start_codon:yes stop_codon:yes gene_type:complete
MEEIRKKIVSRIAEFFNGESTNAEVDTYKKLLDFEKEVKKQFFLHDVSQRSELLIDFSKWIFSERKDVTIKMIKEDVETFLGN